MKEKNMKQEKGITLIALVITIIVLLILAGVAISMLSGENGILNQAAEAKNKTESESFVEQVRIAIMGAMTNEDAESKLPNGYKIVSKYNNSENKDIPIDEDDKSTTYISTGMVIAKDGNEVARTVLFGDFNCDGFINAGDITVEINYLLGNVEVKEDFIKIAMNLNGDNELNGLDYLSDQYIVNNLLLNQKIYASNINELKIDKDSMNRYRYIDGIDIDEIEIFEFDKESADVINVKMKTKEEITVETMLTNLKSNSKIKRNGEELATTEIIKNGDEIVWVINTREINIGKIIIE